MFLQSSDIADSTMTSLINMALGGNRPKVSKKVADILEYKEEFKAGLAEEALTLPDRKPFSDKKSRSDPRNDVIVCSRVTPRLDEEEEEEEEKLESFLPRNPFTFTGDLSFTFKNETRVLFKKYKFFETVGDPLVDIALAGVRMMIWHILYPSWHCMETAALTC